MRHGCEPGSSDQIPTVSAATHAFRSSFRDLAAEETDHPRGLIEVVLAHAVGDKVGLLAPDRICSSGNGSRWRCGWGTWLARLVMHPVTI